MIQLIFLCKHICKANAYIFFRFHSSTTAKTPASLVQNASKSDTPLISLGLHHMIILDPINYLLWKLQTEAILFGYDLVKFTQGTYTCPSSTTDGKETANSDHIPWLRKDQ